MRKLTTTDFIRDLQHLIVSNGDDPRFEAIVRLHIKQHYADIKEECNQYLQDRKRNEM